MKRKIAGQGAVSKGKKGGQGKKSKNGAAEKATKRAENTREMLAAFDESDDEQQVGEPSFDGVQEDGSMGDEEMSGVEESEDGADDAEEGSGEDNDDAAEEGDDSGGGEPPPAVDDDEDDYEDYKRVDAEDDEFAGDSDEGAEAGGVGGAFSSAMQSILERDVETTGVVLGGKQTELMRQIEKHRQAKKDKMQTALDKKKGTGKGCHASGT